MSNHDYVIDNAVGGTVRTDLNNALAAIVENNSGASAPSTTYAHMWWADTSTSKLKRRNAANSAWVEVLPSYDSTYGGLMADPMTTRGDVVVRNSSNATARLAVGANLTVFGSDGTDPAWRTRAALSILALETKDQSFTGGVRCPGVSITTGSFTVDPGDGPLQYVTNGGAFTITAPANDGACDILVTNNASAGSITFSGFTVGSSTGDALTTTNTNKFLVMVRRINGVSTYMIKALQ